jgi:hypothetical protein
MNVQTLVSGWNLRVETTDTWVRVYEGLKLSHTMAVDVSSVKTSMREKE